MGNRYITFYPCPECGKEVEEYDAPSSNMFVVICSCGWHDTRQYFEVIHYHTEDCIGLSHCPKYDQFGPITEQEFRGTASPQQIEDWEEFNGLVSQRQRK